MRDFATVAAALLQSAEAVCAHLLPGGRKVNGEWVAGDLSGVRGRSLSVNLREGVWKDFASGEGGADLINLWAATRQIGQLEAKREAEAWLGLDPLPNRAPVSGRAPAKPLSVSAAIDDGALPSEEPADDDPLWWQRSNVQPTRVWDYTSIDGEVVAQVYRFDDPVRGKVIRPWNPHTGRWEAPKDRELRPLLYLLEIAKASFSSPIVICEGEKATDAVREAGYLATTCMGGAQAVGLTDWSPLEGRPVVYWRDKDRGGRHSAEKMLELLRAARVGSCHLVEPPADAPVGFDAADAPPDQRRAMIERALRGRPVITGRPRLSLIDWTAGRFVGEPPEREMLIEGVFPLGAPVMLAGMGGIGKGLVILRLAYDVAYGQPSIVHPPTALGGRLMHFGRAVILAGEDTATELHSRLARIDQAGARERYPDRMMLVPLPNAGGNFPLLMSSGRGLEITEHFDRLRDELAAVPELKLVVFDPLARFAAANVEREIDASQMLLGALGSLAAELNITVLLSHHMTKARGQREAKIVDAASAREAIRGTTGLVDGVRAAYAMWPELEEARTKALLERAGLPLAGDDWRAALVWGAVVKANGPHDRTVRAYARHEAGALDDITALLRADECGERQSVAHVGGTAKKPERVADVALTADQLNSIADAIRLAEKYGQAFNATGSKSLFGRRGLLPGELKLWKRDALDAAVSRLVADGRILHTRGQPLGVPGGPLSVGTYAPATVAMTIARLAAMDTQEPQP